MRFLLSLSIEVTQAFITAFVTAIATAIATKLMAKRGKKKKKRTTHTPREHREDGSHK